MNAFAGSSLTVPRRNALYRSRIEIYRILRMLAQGAHSLYAEIGNSRTFVSRVLQVDPSMEYFVMPYCANKSLNNRLFEQSCLTFSTPFRNAHLVFEVQRPASALHGGHPVLQFAFPRSLVFHQRREHPRIPVPRHTTLRCIAEAAGFAPFESRIADISHDGLGGLLYDRDIELRPGAVLKGCRIVTPGGAPIVADLEIRHVTPVTLPDGTFANRAGLRFVQRPDELRELIDFFIRDLGDA